MSLRKVLLSLLLALPFAAVSVPAYATKVTVTGGELVGARGVLVGGVAYDVSFLEGSCVALFGGCDDLSDFMFPTEAGATLAAEALLSQVFVDGALGAFDSDPTLTFGCEANASFEGCLSAIPYGLSGSGQVFLIQAFNSLTESTDGTTPANPPIGADTGQLPNVTYARFAVADMSPVPVPPALWLLLGALVVLPIIARRRSA